MAQPFRTHFIAFPLLLLLPFSSVSEHKSKNRMKVLSFLIFKFAFLLHPATLNHPLYGLRASFIWTEASSIIEDHKQRHQKTGLNFLTMITLLQIYYITTLFYIKTANIFSEKSGVKKILNPDQTTNLSVKNSNFSTTILPGQRPPRSCSPPESWLGMNSISPS